VYNRGPIVAALIHAVRLKRKHNAIWMVHAVGAETEEADENTPLRRNG
jgi:hypothetical protein